MYYVIGRAFMISFLKKHAVVFGAVGVMLLWGVIYPLAKLAMQTYEVTSTADTMLFAGIRFVIAGILILLISLVCEKGAMKDARSHLFPILLAGFVSVTLHYTLMYTGMLTAESSKTAIIKQIGALFYVCFSMFFIKEDKPTLKKILGALLGFVGIVVINVGDVGFSLGMGEILILLSSVATVSANVINKKVLDKVAPFTLAGISQLFGGILLVVLGFSLGGRVNLGASPYLMVLLIFFSVCSYLLWYAVMQKGVLSSLFVIKFLEPVFAAFFSALILGEDIFRWQYLVAFLFITLGITLANRKKKEK